ncbi:hypothetical protein ACFP9V_03995 [Deinococcus radiopugnans]|uniref:Chromosome partitioning protein n=1 Tax=Deinococcus radiopugnans ATCC 19172 TaxID=585398 RepID=A0A5C4Y6H5_9DEIO|nr:ParA family protein [Deinococcus radiopugnans]MBB6016915.1 chromosome partitioning protein [Deinococcus radiopugnans ATCC 19172]TNM71469.1 ParA family protein [Deinococcus radiopugnans ATCC 19172]
METPPLPNSRDLLTRAGTLVDLAVVPVAPNGLDVNQLRPTLEPLSELQLQQPELEIAILGTRHNSRRPLAREAQQALIGRRVLSQCVREREIYKAAFSVLPTPLGDDQAVWAEWQR